MNNTDQLKRARRLYEISHNYASRANAKANEARIILEQYIDQKDRLENWKRIMSMAPINLFTFFFVIVAIAEFVFSYDIYREMIRNYPWIMAIAFFGVGIIVSEFIVYLFSKAKRELLFFEKRRNPHNNKYIDLDLKNSILKKAIWYFIIGVILGLVLLYLIYNYSIDRATLEISSGERIDPIGIRDWLPVILYLFELILGVYIFYLLKRLWISFNVVKLKNKFDKLIKEINQYTDEAVRNYQEAEDEGFDPFEDAVSEDVNVAFYRKLNKSVEDKEDYILVPPRGKDFFKVKIVNKEDKPVIKDIKIITKYKLTDSDNSDKNGECTITIDTFPNDAVQSIILRDTADAIDFKMISRSYDLNENEVYTLIVE